MALAELGAQVGSDVPFCVIGGTAMVEGRGERIRKLPAMPECIFVVVKPDFSVSTPELYRKLDETAIARRPDQNAMEAALLSGDIGRVANHLDNVFDPVVTADHLELNYIKSICNSYGSLGQLMTGQRLRRVRHSAGFRVRRRGVQYAQRNVSQAFYRHARGILTESV